jgi:hypothetical protein
MNVKVFISKLCNLNFVSLVLMVLLFPIIVSAKAPVEHSFTGGNVTVTLSFNDYVCIPNTQLVARVKWDATEMDSDIKGTVSLTGNGVLTESMELEKGVWGEFQVTPTSVGLQEYVATVNGSDGCVTTKAKINVGELTFTSPGYCSKITGDVLQNTPVKFVATSTFQDSIPSFEFTTGIIIPTIIEANSTTFSISVSLLQPDLYVAYPIFQVPYSSDGENTEYKSIREGEGIAVIYGDQDTIIESVSE